MTDIRSHYVSQMYLKYFKDSNNERMLWVYDKQDFSYRLQSIKDTAIEKNIYSVGGDQDLEQKFAQIIEDPVKPIFDSWVEDPKNFKTTAQENFYKAAVFLAYAHTRVPRSVESVKEIMNVGLDMVVEKMKKISDSTDMLKEKYNEYCNRDDKSHNMTFEQFCDRYKDPSKDCIFVPNKEKALFQSLEVTNDVLQELIKMNWSLYVVEQDHFFITNDSPLIIYTQVNNKEAIFGGGIGLDNVEIAFPLTPKLCLFICRKKMPPIKNVNYYTIKEINKRIVTQANRFIYSPYKSNRIIRLLKECPAKYGQPKLDHQVIKERMSKLIRQ